MTFSNPVLGKSKMNWFDYWIGHCWMTGWQTIGMAFRNWSDLMTSNYENYALLKEDDPEQECIEWFWVTLNEDDCYSREFLEYLYDLSDRVAKGTEKLIEIDDIDSFFDDLRKED